MVWKYTQPTIPSDTRTTDISAGLTLRRRACSMLELNSSHTIPIPISSSGSSYAGRSDSTLRQPANQSPSPSITTRRGKKPLAWPPRNTGRYLHLGRIEPGIEQWLQTVGDGVSAREDGDIHLPRVNGLGLGSFAVVVCWGWGHVEEAWWFLSSNSCQHGCGCHSIVHLPAIFNICTIK